MASQPQPPPPPPPPPATLTAMPDAVLAAVLDRCCVATLLRLRAACRSLRALASADAQWRPRAAALWEGKDPLLVGRWSSAEPPLFRSYFGSIREAARCPVSAADLCGPEVWCFRFKAAAGDSWVAKDPWWQRKPAIRLRLLPGSSGTCRANGRVQAVSDGRPFWGTKGSVAGRWTMHTLRQSGYVGEHANGAAAEQDLIDATPWPQWLPEPWSPPATTAVEINGHPPYVVGRHPQTWRLYMQSCWCVWTAFDMPARGVDAVLEDAALAVTAEEPAQRCAIERYNQLVGGPITIG